MQSMVDRCYRYVWSRKKEPPLRQMEREKKNMADVRRVGGEVVEVEDREEGVREDRACDADGGWKDGESGDSGMDARIGEMEEAKGKEEEDGMLLEEAVKRSGDRLDRLGSDDGG